jgi:hypothetical protein
LTARPLNGAQTKLIPAFAASLEEQAIRVLEMRQDKFIRMLHAAGINCRHMGLVRQHVENQELRRMILTEIVARVVKAEIARQLRAKMDELKLAFEAPYLHQVCVELFFFSFQ